MKALTSNMIQTLSLFLLLTVFSPKMSGAAPPPPVGQDFSISVKNVTQTSDRTFEFDIYLLDTDPAQAFELASVQCGLTVNPAIYTGGTFSASLVAGTSGLNPAQVPVSVTYTTGEGANLVRLSATAAAGSGGGTVISSVSPGTRIVRIKLTSTVAFPANSYANLAFTPATAIVPSYATRVAMYQAGINTQLNIIPGSNALALENPQLNTAFPLAYAVTGGGTCCDNSGGLPVGLANSQAGTNYTLYRNDMQTGPVISGTGTAINFPGNQAAGNYTVTGTNVNGTSAMLNSVMVLMNPSPIPVIASNSPVCSGTTLTLIGSPASMVSYSWSGVNGFTSTLQNPSIANATTLASGNYALTVTNSFGCAAVANAPLVVNSLPVPAITGPVSICTGATGINYSTEASMTGYMWNVSGGIITSGTGTNSITVTWGAVGTGTVSVNYTNGNLCTGAAPATRSVTISPLPVLQRNLNNIVVADGQSVCADALQTIYVAGGGTTFIVSAGGISHLVAGQNIIFYPGATVQNGGYLHAYIATDCLYCTAPKSAPAASPADSTAFLPPSASVTGNDLFKVFPNPTAGMFTMEMTSMTEGAPAIVELFGMQGKLITKMELINQDSHTFNLTNHPAGLYFIRVVSGNKERSCKILKY
ncbi:MAG: T9SS type A sorting domain-containing protein [Bacteroidetes bacterium]|nr:T9SS type A sorting domain-containing protein [Bacteroidota bacterium]